MLRTLLKLVVEELSFHVSRTSGSHLAKAIENKDTKINNKITDSKIFLIFYFNQ
ncbi:MAG: hypothetical protein ABIK50_04405 [candidate division WOR-3 bacterium]